MANQPPTEGPPQEPVVFLDITIGGEPLGRIKIHLFSNTVPKTAENFRQFCTGETKDAQGKPKGYKGSKFHRVVQGFMCQGGDIVQGNGQGATCIWGTKYFDDESFAIRHDQPGAVAMANSGKNTNGCQFYITCAQTPSLDKKHVVFGRVVEGQDIVMKMNNVRTDRDEKPRMDVVVSQCGEM